MDEKEKYRYIEEQLRNNADDQHFQYDPEDWNALEKMLDEDKKPVLGLWRWGFLALLFTLALGFGYWMISTPSSQNPIVDQNVILSENTNSLEAESESELIDLNTSNKDYNEIPQAEKTYLISQNENSSFIDKLGIENNALQDSKDLSLRNTNSVEGKQFSFNSTSIPDNYDYLSMKIEMGITLNLNLNLQEVT